MCRVMLREGRRSSPFYLGRMYGSKDQPLPGRQDIMIKYVVDKYYP